MDIAEVEKKYNQICGNIFKGRLKEALDETGQFIKSLSKSEYYYQLESFTENYKNLLHYAFEGYKDPQQKIILANLSASLLGMADEIRYTLIMPFRRIRRQELMTLSREPENYSVSFSQSERNFDLVFRWIWLTRKLGENHINLIRSFFSSEYVEWYDKCLIISAITISLLDYFDTQKFLLLIEFCEAGQDQIYQRALTGLILALIAYDKRIVFYQELSEKLERISRDENICKDIEMIMLQLLMARETEKISKEFEEEVLPEMKRMMPKIEDKLQLGQPEEEEDMEGKNPGWKDLVEEVPGLFEKIEKFSKMQIEGADVFMSTFKLLKRFDFFNVMSNWFIPFHPGHPEINKSVPETDEINQRLIESLAKAFYICNSDKYSFALNFQAIPAQQRSMIVTNFEAEFAQMQEMASEEQLLDKSLQSNAIFTQYIQDFYRFFKLYPSKDEFEDVFQRKFRFNELFFYQTFIEKEGFTERLASFYFEKEHYHEAIEIYEYIISKSVPRGEYYEKIAYSFQKTGRFKKAVEFYRKAELFDTNRLWILKKLGWCSLKLKDYTSALNYFREASSLQPDDMNLWSQVGQCYLNLKDFAQALQTYSKVGFFSTGNLKVLRPIAYCQFVLGKLIQAETTYTEILEIANPVSPYDLMNAGHVQLCLNKRKNAADLYNRCLSAKNTRQEDLFAAFNEDVPYLIRNGISPDEIPLIKDYLIFQSESS